MNATPEAQVSFKCVVLQTTKLTVVFCCPIIWKNLSSEIHQQPPQ